MEDSVGTAPTSCEVDCDLFLSKSGLKLVISAPESCDFVKGPKTDFCDQDLL